MNMRKHPWTAAVLFAMCGSFAAAQQPWQLTLSERIQRRPDPTAPFTEVQGNDEISFDMESLLKGADRIVYGRVESAQTTLEAGKKYLVTDYNIAPIRTLWPRTVSERSVPGIGTSLVVTRWGGEATVDGVAVSQLQSSFPLFHVGDQLVVCLQLDSKSGKYGVVANRAVFSVQNDRVRPWTTHVEYQKYRDMPLVQLESRVQVLRSMVK